jgi:transmembrane sensor
MKPPEDENSVEHMAAAWVLRQDRGLTAAEQDALSLWLAVDPRHRAAWAECRHGWEELDRLAGLQASAHAVPDPDLLAPRRRALLARFMPFTLALAAAVVVGLFLWPTAQAPVGRTSPHTHLPVIEQRLLADGSTVQLNRGSVLAVDFTPAERRVRLVRGEAHFTVAKNPARPFIVVAHGVEVQAVGTVFNVSLGESAVEVLVTEGKVRVAHPDGGSPGGMSAIVPLLASGEQVVVPLTAGMATAGVSRLTPEEIAEKLAWRPSLLDFADASLADIATEFNRHNPVRLVLGEPALGAVRLSANFRSDNVEGFVRLMESDFGMVAERRGETEIVLHRGK